MGGGGQGRGPVGWSLGSSPWLEWGSGGWWGPGPVRGPPWVLAHKGDSVVTCTTETSFWGRLSWVPGVFLDLEGKEAGQWSAPPSRQPSVLWASLPMLRDDSRGGWTLCLSLPIWAWWASLGLSWGADYQRTGKSCRCLGLNPYSAPLAVWPRASGSASLGLS